MSKRLYLIQFLLMLALALILTMIALMLLSPDRAEAQTLTPPPAPTLTVLVRAINGTPLPGVSLTLYETGPPHEHYRTLTTDPAGTSSLTLNPGAYLVAFEGQIEGQPIIDPALQNAGTYTAGDVGGFAIAITGTGPQVVAFVLTPATSGAWLPLFDLSRDPDAAPQPYTYTGPIDDETHLDPVALALRPDLDSTIHDVLILPATPTPLPTNQSEHPTTSSILFPLLILAALIGLLFIARGLLRRGNPHG